MALVICVKRRAQALLPGDRLFDEKLLLDFAEGVGLVAAVGFERVTVLAERRVGEQLLRLLVRHVFPFEVEEQQLLAQLRVRLR